MPVTTTYSFANVTSEFGVNNAIAGAQTAPAVVQRTDGNLVFAFQSAEATAPSQDTLGRIFTTAGLPVGSDFFIQGGTGDLETAPRLAALTNGAVVAVYSDSVAQGSDGGISTAFRIFTGTAGTFPTLFENESDDQTAPAIVALGSGFVIAHLDQFGGSTTVNSITVQRYTAEGATNGSSIVVADSINGSPFRAPAIAALSDGGFVVVWAADVTAGVGENFDIFAQRYNAAGAVNGGLITINSEADNQDNPVVTALSGGAFAVAWEDEETGSRLSGNIDYTTVDGAGAVGLLQTITATGRQEQPSIAILPSDLFVISYSSNEAGNQDIRAVAANAAGTLATTGIDVGIGAQVQPATVSLSSGAFFTSWSDLPGDGSGSRIAARQDRLGRLSVGDDNINGIIGDDLQDTVDGANGSDTIDGAGGDDLLQGGLSSDSIQGGGGNDLLFAMTQASPDGSSVGDTMGGGSGDDFIRGAQGNDTVDGGTGDDLIDGSDGDDLLQGGLDADTIMGGEGNDTIFANIQASPTGSTIGDVMAGGNGRDTVTGSEGADQIFGGAGDDSLAGNGGADVLYGDAGNDTMVGSTGEDQYVVNDIGDVVTEMAWGGDADTVFVGTNGWVNFANIEIVRLFGTAISVTGLGGNEQIVANSVIVGGSQILARGGNDVLWGSAYGDVLIGGDGSDTIRGGAGDDEMYGGDGVDIFVVEQLGDQMFETPGDGYDTAYITVDNYVMPESGGAFAATIEVAYLAGSAIFLNGSSSGENLVANPTAGSVLAAYGGNDILYGSGFGDSFTGGTGSDIIYSGGGADAIRFIENDWGFDQVSDFTPGAGDRLVFSAASGVTSFGQLGVLTNATDTQLSFGGNTILLYNYLGWNAGDVQFIA